MCLTTLEPFVFFIRRVLSEVFRTFFLSTCIFKKCVILVYILMRVLPMSVCQRKLKTFGKSCFKFPAMKT